MKIQLIGTGSILTNHLSACAVVNDKIMVDCPNGSIKALRMQHILPTQIDVCLLTHFHADHYFDIPFMLLEQGIRPIREKDFIVVGPPNTMQQIELLFQLAYPEDWDTIKKQSKLKVVEVDENETPIIIDGYEIIPYKVQHLFCDAYGYTISAEKKTVGFTGDSILCPAVENIVQKSNLVFADMSFEKSTKSHMGLNDMRYLKNIYGNSTQIIPTHMTDNVRMSFQSEFFTPPIEGEIFEV